MIYQQSWKGQKKTFSKNQITATADVNEHQVQNEGGPKKTGKTKSGNNLLGHIIIQDTEVKDKSSRQA